MSELDVADRLVWRLACECRAGDVLIVGVATPIAVAAGLLARALLVPDLTVLVAASVQPGMHDIARPMLEPDYVARLAAGTFGQAEVLDLIGRGGVTLQFVSPAQIDRQGRLNATEVQRPDGSRLRLPGPLALPDVSCLVGRLVGYRAAHSRRFLVPSVDYVTGSGDRLAAVVTELGVLRFGGDEVALESLAPGVTLTEVVGRTGFRLETESAVTERPPPGEALELLNAVIDPHGIRGLEVPGTRAAARARLEALG